MNSFNEIVNCCKRHGKPLPLNLPLELERCFREESPGWLEAARNWVGDPNGDSPDKAEISQLLVYLDTHDNYRPEVARIILDCARTIVGVRKLCQASEQRTDSLEATVAAASRVLVFYPGEHELHWLTACFRDLDLNPEQGLSSWVHTQLKTFHSQIVRPACVAVAAQLQEEVVRWTSTTTEIHVLDVFQALLSAITGTIAKESNAVFGKIHLTIRQRVLQILGLAPEDKPNTPQTGVLRRPVTWHLRRIGFIRDLTRYLLRSDSSESKISRRTTRVPFAFVFEDPEQPGVEKEEGRIAHFVFELMPEANGQIFLNPSQAFLEFTPAFATLFQEVFQAVTKQIREQTGKLPESSPKSQDNNIPDVRVTVEFDRPDQAPDGRDHRGRPPSETRMILDGTSATGAGGRGLYFALMRKVPDAGVLVLASLDGHQNLTPVRGVRKKVEAAVARGDIDTIVVVKGDDMDNPAEARKSLDDNRSDVHLEILE